jgi:hypothetical protein
MNKRIARLFYVGSKRSRVLHLSKHITEGYRTLCGIMIPEPGKWYWAKSRFATVRAQQAPLCKKCDSKRPAISVMRVRR